MVLERKHTLIFTLPGTGGGFDEVTGFPIPETLGPEVRVECRFHQNSTKVLKNEDSTESQQVGRIRVAIGALMPRQWQNIRVVEGDLVHYEGTARYIDKTGTLLSWRIDV
jgi:hypothetical protein